MKKVLIPDEARCIECKRHFDLTVLRERSDYNPGICPICGGMLRSVYERIKPSFYGG